MSRLSIDTPLDGYDYINQAWYRGGVYIRCGHPAAMQCECYGLINEGKAVKL